MLSVSNSATRSALVLAWQNRENSCTYRFRGVGDAAPYGVLPVNGV